jgi:hypothetical protein
MLQRGPGNEVLRTRNGTQYGRQGSLINYPHWQKTAGTR